MTSTNLSLIALLLLGLACLAFILFAVQRARQSRGQGADHPPGAPVAQPVAPAAASDPVPQPADPASPFLAAPDGAPDDLMQIKGIGPKLSARLAELGVFHYAQIAGWTPAQLAAVDAELGTFQGRPERDQWQSQARLLGSGDLKAYERAHGKLGAPTGPAA
jgi:predicted flap endonuclease-1-like 5' DNA nuclease